MQSTGLQRLRAPMHLHAPFKCGFHFFCELTRKQAFGGAIAVIVGAYVFNSFGSVIVTALETKA